MNIKIYGIYNDPYDHLNREFRFVF